MSYGKNNKTPAPTRPAAPLKGARDGQRDYGTNTAQGSSIVPGESAPASWLRDDIVASNGDDVLASVVARGTARVPADWQTRKVDASPIKPSENMHANDGSPSGKVAAGLVNNQSDPVRRPGG